MDILQMLYRGEIRPEEKYHQETPELCEAKEGYLEREEKLLGRIEGPVREEIWALLEERAEVAALEMEDAYVRGMRMGAQLMGELLAKKDRPNLT